MWSRRLYLLLASVLLLAGCGEAASPTADDESRPGVGRGATEPAAADAVATRGVERFQGAANAICRATPIPMQPPDAADPAVPRPRRPGGPGGQGAQAPEAVGREAAIAAGAIQRRLELLQREPVPIPLRLHVARLLDDLDGLRRLRLAAATALEGEDRDRARAASLEENARREAAAAGLQDCVLPVAPAG